EGDDGVAAQGRSRRERAGNDMARPRHASVRGDGDRARAAPVGTLVPVDGREASGASRVEREAASLDGAAAPRDRDVRRRRRGGRGAERSRAREDDEQAGGGRAHAVRAYVAAELRSRGSTPPPARV